MGRTGKYNRIRTLSVYELTPSGRGTRVKLTFESEPKLPSDKFLERLGGRGWRKRNQRKAMRRLQSILEEDYGRGTRPTIAGGARKPATGSPFRG